MANSLKPMGIGVIGQSDVVFKRKFRWTFELQGFCNNQSNVVPEYFVKMAGRPNLEVEETEINHLNGKMWIPGKASWQTISVTYIDVAHNDMKTLWNWLASVYDFTDPINLKQGNRKDWDATGVISLYDGCGVLLETWQLKHCWPTEINFGELDYSDSEPAEIELTLRYWDVVYTPFCPAFNITPCCTGCGN
jgi:hypothetical protein